MYLQTRLIPAQCPSMTVAGGTVVVTGNNPGSVATVTCDAGLWADNGDPQMTMRCRDNGKWTYPQPTCSSKLGFLIMSGILSHDCKYVVNLLTFCPFHFICVLWFITPTLLCRMVFFGIIILVADKNNHVVRNNC